MLNSRKITLRVSEDDFRKIEQIRDGRTITQFFRELVKDAVEKERIVSSDISKISEKLDEVLRLMEVLEQKHTKKTLIGWWKSFRK